MIKRADLWIFLARLHPWRCLCGSFPQGLCPARGQGLLLGQGGVGGAVPAPFLTPWTFQDIPSPAVGAQPFLAVFASLGGVWNFVGGNVAGGISTCHQQIHLVRERGLTFLALVGG